MLKLLLAAGAVLSTSAAYAADFAPIAKGHSMVMTGDIVGGDDERFRQAYNASCARYGRCPERMFLNSFGGSVSEAYKLTDMVITGILNRGYAFDMVVGAADTCASACFVVFAVGTKHVVFPTSMIGVHSISEVNTQGLAIETPDSAALTVAQARWLASFGVPEAIITKIVTTDSGSVSWLSARDDEAGWFTVLEPKGKTYVPADRGQFFYTGNGLY